MITFHVDGLPKAQPRPKAFAMRFGEKHSARMYDPGTAEGWKAAVALAARPHRPASPIEGPVRLSIRLFMPRPKRLCRKSDPPGPVWCVAKPDWDNAGKPIADCLTNLGWWRDDAQVVDSRVTKHYHAIGGRPGATIEIEELEPSANRPASQHANTVSRGDRPLQGALSHSPAEEPATKSPRGAGGGRHSTAPVQASRGPGIHAEVVGAAAPPSAAASAHSPTRKVTNEQ